jgi:hypothetical protein
MKDHCILNKSENPKFETGAGVGMENSKFEIRNRNRSGNRKSNSKQDYFTQNTFILLIKPLIILPIILSQSKQSF